MCQNCLYEICSNFYDLSGIRKPSLSPFFFTFLNPAFLLYKVRRFVLQAKLFRVLFVSICHSIEQKFHCLASVI